MEVIEYFIDIIFIKDIIPYFITQACLEIVYVMFTEVTYDLSFARPCWYFCFLAVRFRHHDQKDR